MIVKTIEGKDYFFEITRKGLRMAEQQGMKINEMMDKPMSMLYYLWYAALYAKQPMSMSKSDELLDKYLDDEGSESMTDILEWLSEDFSRVFGSAVE